MGKIKVTKFRFNNLNQLAEMFPGLDAGNTVVAENPAISTAGSHIMYHPQQAARTRPRSFSLSGDADQSEQATHSKTAKSTTEQPSSSWSFKSIFSKASSDEKKRMLNGADRVAIFKPQDEEGFSPNNPFWRQSLKKFLHYTLLRPFRGNVLETMSGSGCISEKLHDEVANIIKQAVKEVLEEDDQKEFSGYTYLRDIELFPHTELGEIELKKGTTKKGSVQRWVNDPTLVVLPHDFSGIDKDFNRVAFELVTVLHKITGNFDTTGDNFFKRKTEDGQTYYTAIDGGWAFAPSHSSIFSFFDKRNKFKWATLKECDQQYDRFTQEVIKKLHQKYSDQLKMLVCAAFLTCEEYLPLAWPLSNAVNRAKCMADRLETLNNGVDRGLTIRQIAKIKDGAQIYRFIKSRHSRLFHLASIVATTTLMATATFLTFGLNWPLIFAATFSGLLIASMSSWAQRQRGKASQMSMVRFLSRLLPKDALGKTVFTALALASAVIAYSLVLSLGVPGLIPLVNGVYAPLIQTGSALLNEMVLGAAAALLWVGVSSTSQVISHTISSFAHSAIQFFEEVQAENTYTEHKDEFYNEEKESYNPRMFGKLLRLRETDPELIEIRRLPDSPK